VKDIQGLWRPWIAMALIFFFIAALLGLSMRYFFVEEIPFLSYRNILHSHSHTALLGWSYMLLTGSLFISYGIDTRGLAVFRKLFYVNVVCVVGMVFSFLFQGYGPVSIAFATAHMISTYVYAWHYLRYLRSKESSTARYFIRWAIRWQLISTLGLWAVGPVVAIYGKLHPLYSASIQFFLHFQMNGWFTFAVLGLLFHYLAKSGRKVELRTSTLAMLQLSLLCTYFLSVTWSTPIPLLFYINSFGVVIQLWAFVRIFRTLRKKAPGIFAFKNLPSALLTLGLFSMLFKVLIQSALVLPQMAVVSYTIHNFVIAFIHLIMLGSITFSMAGILLDQGALSSDRSARTGWRLLIIGFFLMEFILFGQGLMLWTGFGFISYYYEIIFGVSAFLPVAVAFIVLGHFSKQSARIVVQSQAAD
jgi:hypothetical protein